MADEEEMSMEEILASIRNILWEKEVAKSASRSCIRDYAKEKAGDVFELTKDMLVKGWALPYEYSDWNFDDELISYATSLSAGTQNPMQYMNKLLSNWYTLKINTIEKAKANSQTVKNAPNTQKDKLNESYKQTNFSKEFLDSLITNLDEVDV